MSVRTTEEAVPGKGFITLSRDHLWPALILIGLALMVAVNVAFIWIAVSGADEVAPSYVAGER